MKRPCKSSDFVHRGMKILPVNELIQPMGVPSGNWKDNYFRIKRFVFFLFFLLAHHCYAQKHKGFDPHYQFLNSDNLIAEKNFYLLTVFEHSPEIGKLIANNNALSRIYSERAVLVKTHITDTCNWPCSLLCGFKYDPQDSLLINNALAQLYDANKTAFDIIIEKQLRPSGYYQLFAEDDNKALFLRAWAQVVTGINYIIDQFGLGKKLRYPSIDSASFFVNGIEFRGLIKDMFKHLSEEKTGALFFNPSLSVSLKLMDINGRDEPARNEPLQDGLNKAAYKNISATNFKKYPYSAILLLGSGPDVPGVALSTVGKTRSDTAASRYKMGMAPFIITSGGYVSPFRTHYSEAIEMKKYLMAQYGIPEWAIIVEPFARHTTTNIRNANRLIFRYGIPATMPVLVISSALHIVSITAPQYFDKRNMRELGYLPYKGMTYKSVGEARYIPALISLHMDPGDPLDP